MMFKNATARRGQILLVLVMLLLPLTVTLAEATVPAALGANAGWVEFGTGSATSGGVSDNGWHSYRPSLAIAADGVPTIAWYDSEGEDSEIYVRRWNGSIWAEVGAGSATGGGVSNNGGSSTVPSLAIAPNGNPYVAWSDGSSGESEIYVKYWNGSAWVELGGSATDGGVSNYNRSSESPSLALGPDGMPVVAWAALTSSDYEIFVRRWNGNAWVELGTNSASGGGISNNLKSSVGPSLAVGPDGNPVVAWVDRSGGDREIYVKKWSGSAWLEVGVGSASGGGVSNNLGGSEEPSLALSVDGKPIVAWRDDSNHSKEIYVRQWTGSAWAEIGSGSASGSGVSQTTVASEPTLATADDGTPMIAWVDGSSGNVEIYFRYWDGLAWVEKNAGSASDGGISSNTSWSTAPSLAVSPDAIPLVAWHDDGGGDREIYVRYYDESAPRCYALSRIHTGQGSDPTASPSNSTGCLSGQYLSSEAITLTAFPTSGWQVTGWTGTSNDASTSTTNTVQMPDGAHTVGVIYEQSPSPCYALTRTHTGQGSDPVATPTNSEGCPSGQYFSGETIVLSASPGSGWQVAGWTGTSNDASTSTANTLIMPAGAHTVGVSYEQNPPACYALTRTHTGQGIDPVANPPNSGGCSTGQYIAGENISITASPAAGWQIAGWSGTVNDSATASTNGTVMPAAGHTVTVHYEQIPIDDQWLFYVPAIAFECFAGPLEAEPNNSQATANGPLCLGMTYIGYPNDRNDYFSIVLPGAANLRVEVTGLTGQPAQLQLWSGGALLAAAVQPPFLITRALAPGTYHIRLVVLDGYSSSEVYLLDIR